LYVGWELFKHCHLLFVVDGLVSVHLPPVLEIILGLDNEVLRQFLSTVESLEYLEEFSEFIAFIDLA